MYSYTTFTHKFEIFHQYRQYCCLHVKIVHTQFSKAQIEILLYRQSKRFTHLSMKDTVINAVSIRVVFESLCHRVGQCDAIENRYSNRVENRG